MNKLFSALYFTVVTRKPSWAEEENDEEDCAPVPTFQSAFSDALVSANWGKYDVETTQPGKSQVEISCDSPARHLRLITLNTTGEHERLLTEDEKTCAYGNLSPQKVSGFPNGC